MDEVGGGVTRSFRDAQELRSARDLVRPVHVYMRAELTQPLMNKYIFRGLNYCYCLVNDVIDTSRVVGDATSSSILQK